MQTQVFFGIIVVAVILQRLWELNFSRRNEVYLLARGAIKHSDNLLGMVKVLQITWWLAMLLEVWFFSRPFIPLLAVIGILATVTGQILRYLSIRALGKRWTLPIITIPGIPAVRHGIYRYLTHPNWLGVMLEIAGLPLIHGAYLTAICFSIANAFLLNKRMVAEQLALAKNNLRTGFSVRG